MESLARRTGLAQRMAIEGGLAFVRRGDNDRRPQLRIGARPSCLTVIELDVKSTVWLSSNAPAV